MPIGRIMALDVGERRIGVAVSDPLWIAARPLVTIDRRAAHGRDGGVAATLALVRAHDVHHVVVSDPRYPSGDPGPRSAMVDAFVARLEAGLAGEAIPIERWDESYTTEAATARLRARGVDLRRVERARLDAEAAAVILEEWLRAHTGAPPVSPDFGGRDGTVE